MTSLTQNPERQLEDLSRRGVGSFCEKRLDFFGQTEGEESDLKTAPMQNLMFQLLGAFSEFECALIRERHCEGIALV